MFKVSLNYKKCFTFTFMIFLESFLIYQRKSKLNSIFSFSKPLLCKCISLCRNILMNALNYFTNQFMQKSDSIIIKVNYYAMVTSSSKECIENIKRAFKNLYSLLSLTCNFEKDSIFLKYRE